MAFYFRVKRKILKLFFSTEGSANWDKVTLGALASKGVKLKLVPIQNINKDYIREADLTPREDGKSNYDNNILVLLLTDGNGAQVSFNENGDPDLDGKPSYYWFREIYPNQVQDGKVFLTKYDKEIARSKARQKKISLQEAEAEVLKELQFVYDVRQAYQKDPNLNLLFDITGGSFGYAELDKNLRVPISDISFGKKGFVPEYAEQDDPATGKKSGKTYFTTDETGTMAIEIQRPEMRSNQEIVDQVVDLLFTDAHVEIAGQIVPLSVSDRQKLIGQFFLLRPSGLDIPGVEENGSYRVKLDGDVIYQSLPTKAFNKQTGKWEDVTHSSEAIAEDRKNAEEAANKAREYFNTLRPESSKPMQSKDLTDSQKSRVISGTDIDQVRPLLQVGSIFHNTTDNTYWSIGYPKMNIKRDFLKGDYSKVSFETKQGKTVLKETKLPYKNYIRDNFTMQYQLNGEGKIVNLNAYFTFEATDQALEQLYGKPQEPEVKIEVPTPKIEDSSIVDNNIKEGLDAALDDPDFNKNLDQKNVDKKATLEQVAQAKAWYEASPLSKHFPFEEMFNMVNSKNPRAVANWTMHGITLYKGADYSDLYHEAWHGFTQAFLTKKQKKDLYAEVAKKSGSFIDYKGRRVSFKYASEKQLEEYLAEDFRRWMLDGGKKAIPDPVKKSIFQRILDFLKFLFSDLTIQDINADTQALRTIHELYDKLRVGNLNEFSFSESNTTFENLDKGMVALKEDALVSSLSYEDSRFLVETMDSFMSKFVDDFSKGKRDALYSQNIDSVKSSKWTSILLASPKGLKYAYQQILKDVVAVRNGLARDLEKETLEPKKNALQKQINRFDWLIENYGNAEKLIENRPKKGEDAKGAIAYHMLKSRILDERTKEDFFDESVLEEKDLFLKGREGYDRSGNESSLTDLASKEIISIIGSLHKVDKQGNTIYVPGTETTNEEGVTIGVPELEDFDKVWNTLAKNLQNTVNADIMFANMVQMGNKNKDFPMRQLLEKFGIDKNGYSIEEKVDTETFALRTKFWQTFNKAYVPLLQTTVEIETMRGEEKLKAENWKFNIYPGQAFGNVKRVRREWDKLFASETSEFIKPNAYGVNVLDIQAVLDKFPAHSLSKPENELAFYRAIGIKLDEGNPDILKAIQEARVFANKFRWILVNLVNRKDKNGKPFVEITKPSQLAASYPAFGDQPALPGEASNYNELANIQAKFSDKWNNFMVTNAEGNTQFEHSLNNSLTILINSLNDAESYQDLISLPWMTHLDVKKNFFTGSSVWLNSLFDMKEFLEDGSRNPDYGKKRLSRKGVPVKINLENLSGIAVKEDDDFNTDLGVASAKADAASKLIMDFHMVLLKGAPELTRHADKGTSFSVFLSDIFVGGKHQLKSTYIDTVDFLKQVGSTDYSIGDDVLFENFMLPYISSELQRIQKMRELDAQRKKDPSSVQNFDFNYLERGKGFVMFSDVLPAKLKKKLLKVDGDLLSVVNSGSAAGLALKKELFEAVTEYFRKETDRVQKMFDKVSKVNGQSLISDNLYKVLAGSARDAGIGSQYGDAAKIKNNAMAKRALVKSFVTNSWIHNFESLSIIYGDVAQYNMVKDEFHKRNAGAGSTGNIYRTDRSAISYINNNIQRPLTAQRTQKEYRPFDGTFNTAIVKDNEIRSTYFKEYAEAMIDAEMAKNGGNKAKAEEKILGKGGTIDKPVKGGLAYAYQEMTEGDGQGWISFDSYRILLILEGKWNNTQESMYQDILAGKTIPFDQVSEFFPTQKLQYWGPLKTDGIPLTAMHKFSLFPLIPTVIKDKRLSDLHNRMMDKGVDYVVFNSGSKISNITKEGEYDKLYIDETNREIAPDDFTINTIFLNFLKNQLEIAPKYKHKVIFSTQLRKLIEDGMIEGGVPTDFGQDLNLDDRRAAWKALGSEAARLKVSKKYRLFKAYEANVQKLMDIKKEELMDEIGWTIQNGKPSGNLKTLLEFVRAELTRQDLSDHEVDFIDLGPGGKDLKHDLSMSLSADKIEKLLNALVTRRLINQKVNGEGLIQVSGAGFESVSSTGRNYTNPTEEDKKRWGTNDLPTYHRTESAAYGPETKINIYAGTGENTELSNFAQRPFETQIGGTVYKFNTVEGAFQAAKLEHTDSYLKTNKLTPEQEQILVKLQTASGANAKRIGRTIAGLNVKSWDDKSSFIMKDLLTESFKQNPDALKKLAATGRATLTHTQDKGKWGKEFPKLLMEVRDDLVTFGDGKTSAMKVKVAMQGQFKKLLRLKDKEGNTIYTIDKLNSLLKDDEWLDMNDHRRMVTMVGVRIPVQSLNSMEFMEVYEFLPEEAGNIIIPPAEIVAKSGSDFDIDKLTVMMPSYRKEITADGTSTVSLAKQIGEKEARVLYDNYKKYRIASDRKKEEISVKTPGTKQLEDLTIYNDLIYEIFGVSSEELDDEYAKMLIEEGKMKTFEEFHRSLNGSKAVENDLIWNIKEILEQPDNFVNLITPNGTDIVKPLADNLADKVTDYNIREKLSGDMTKEEYEELAENPKAIQGTRVMEIGFNLYKHSSNNIGKQTLGLGAVDNTFNVIFNRIGAHMRPYATIKYGKNKSKQVTVRQTLLMPHRTLKVDGEDAISLSHTTDVNNENRISDIISQLINGWVDIAKDAWIFNIQGNKEITPTLLFMVQAGVPFQTAVYLSSQPIIRKYVEAQRLAKSTFGGLMGTSASNINFYREKAREMIFEELGIEKDILKKKDKFYSYVQEKTQEALAADNNQFVDTKLKAEIDSHNPDQPVYSDYQQAAFLHFLEIEEMGKAVRDVKMRMNFDTAKSGSLFEAQNKTLLVEELRENGRIPENIVDGILKHSIIGTFYIQEFQVNVWEKLFPLRNNAVFNTWLSNKLKDGIMDDVNKTFGDSEEFVNQLRNSFISFIFQNELKSFNVDNITHYKGDPVEGIMNLKEKVENLSLGVFFKNGKVYVDKDTLKFQYRNQSFMKPDYTDLGLARFDNNPFESYEEYTHFVFEREYLRSIYPSISSLRKNSEFRNFVKLHRQENKRKEGETAREYLDRTNPLIYENFLKEKALENILNINKLFVGKDTFADKLVMIKNMYPELAEEFSLLKKLVVDSRIVGNTAYSNIKLQDSMKDRDILNLYYENMVTLMDPTIKKVERADDNKMISEFFSLLPLVGFLQSGLNSKSQLSINRIMPQDSFIRLMEGPVKKYSEKMNPVMLDLFYKRFVEQNDKSRSFLRNRFTNYVVPGFSLDESYKASKEAKFYMPKPTERVKSPDAIVTDERGITFLNTVATREVNLKELAEANPNMVFVFNDAFNTKVTGAQPYDLGFKMADVSNKIGLPSYKQYNVTVATAIQDENGQPNQEIKERIDQAIEVMKSEVEKGKTLVFSDRGYGQEWNGFFLKEPKSETLKNSLSKILAPETFLYLSKRLYEEFGYLNPGYRSKPEGKTIIQANQEITDEMVRDFMSKCYR